LLDTLDTEELMYWIEYHRIDPITSDRDDLRFGMLCAVTANAMTGSKLKPADFMPDFSAIDEDLADDQLKLQGMKFVAAYGGKFC
jgi:hypothetical protein